MAANLTSKRKHDANRTNAQASTGPKTARGKARASQNARRHGLSLSVLTEPTLSAKVEKLAREIAGEGALPEIIAIGRRIAEAQVDIDRVRQVRQAYMTRGFDGSERDTHGFNGPQEKKSARVFPSLTKELVAINRYEQRALSRRKFAIRELDALRRQTNNRS